MNTDELMERSKTSFEHSPNVLTLKNDQDPLVTLRATSNMDLEPIWEKPLDKRETGLYKSYYQAHPEQAIVRVRRSLADKLYRVSKLLPPGLKLVIRDGFRPLALQQQLLEALENEYLQDNQNTTQKRALKYASTFVTNPATDMPPHCCGAAVDVDVYDTSTSSLVDFGCPVNNASDTSYLHSQQVTKKQHENRMMLLRAMLDVGFTPCFVEWWHFSYGDSVWANFYEQPKVLFGIITD